MTQLGEGVALGTVDKKDIECPFHDPEHEHDDIKNVFDGDAKALGEALVDGKNATGTIARNKQPDISHFKKLVQEPDPDKTNLETYPLIENNKNCIYPLGFQAHHLIPAKESLAKAKGLLRFMGKGKLLCCNLGYNVNGNQNGAWLPGKHPVDGNGLDLWKGKLKPPKDNEGHPRVKIAKRGDRDYVELRGFRPGHPSAFKLENMRWLYVYAAMNSSLGKRQFHDRHPHYSGNVLNHLQSLGEALGYLAGTSKLPPACSKCKKSEKGKITPPIPLLGALNALSARYRNNYVYGKIEHSDYYTSSWCDPARKALTTVEAPHGRGREASIARRISR